MAEGPGTRSVPGPSVFPSRLLDPPGCDTPAQARGLGPRRPLPCVYITPPPGIRIQG